MDPEKQRELNFEKPRRTGTMYVYLTPKNTKKANPYKNTKNRTLRKQENYTQRKTRRTPP